MKKLPERTRNKADRGKQIIIGKFSKGKGLKKIGNKYVLEETEPGRPKSKLFNEKYYKKHVWDKNGNLIFETERHGIDSHITDTRTIKGNVKKYKNGKLVRHTNSKITKTGTRKPKGKVTIKKRK